MPTPARNGVPVGETAKVGAVPVWREKRIDVTPASGNTVRSPPLPITKFAAAGVDASICRRTFSSSDVALWVVKTRCHGDIGQVELAWKPAHEIGHVAVHVRTEERRLDPVAGRVSNVGRDDEDVGRVLAEQLVGLDVQRVGRRLPRDLVDPGDLEVGQR